MRKRTVDKDVYELACERVRRTYELHDNVAVMFSGGKDSTVLLNVTLDVAREIGRAPVDVVFYDEEAIPPETVEYMHRVRQREDVRLHWYCCPIKHRNACSRDEPFWYPWDPAKRKVWVRELPECDVITTRKGIDGMLTPETHAALFGRKLGTTALMFGFRTAESLRRFRGVTHRTKDNYIALDPKSKWISLVKPIYDWSTEDVWSAPRIMGWDWNRAYEVMRMAGMTAHSQRCSPPFGDEPLQRLWTYSVCWPELWEKMLLRVSGAASAGRYAISPLYGYHGVAGWDPSEDPRVLIEHALTRWSDAERKIIAQRIRREIHRHYQISPGEAIPSDEVGYSGVSWKWLFMIAVRGDLKGRRTPALGERDDSKDARKT